MNRRGSRYLIAGLTAAAVLLLAVLSIRFGGLLWMEKDPEREQSMTSEDPHAIRSVARREGDTDPGRAKRQMALQALKRRWLDLEADGNGGGNAEVMALARESAAQLLFSPETFQLLEFLKNRRMEEALSRTEDAVTMLLFSAGATEARASLAALSSRVTPATPATQVLLEQWSFSAGRACDRAEFEAFVASLHNERAAESATLGRNIRLAQTDPAAALESSLQLVEAGGENTMRGNGFITLVEDLPEESDFGQLERILPAHGSVGLADRAREEILGKWALVDMESAANHVMENPGRIPPEAMKVVVSVALDSGDDSVLQWIRNLPEGAFLDQAAVAVVERSIIAAPDAAHEFVEMIQNEEMRARILKRIREASGRHLQSHEH